MTDRHLLNKPSVLPSLTHMRTRSRVSWALLVLFTTSSELAHAQSLRYLPRPVFSIPSGAIPIDAHVGNKGHWAVTYRTPNKSDYFYLFSDAGRLGSVFNGTLSPQIAGIDDSTASVVGSILSGNAQHVQRRPISLGLGSFSYLPYDTSLGSGSFPHYRGGYISAGVMDNHNQVVVTTSDGAYPS
jgi:hypothetical protein